MTRKQFGSFLITALVLGICLYLLSFPALPGQAAPEQLPSCGHNSISASPSTVSGPPDLARSRDAAATNTAVVWAEGNINPIGTIELAYSSQAKTDRRWRRFTVDSGVNNQNPTVVFDPANINVVHVAYQKVTPNTGGNSGIFYARCQLSSSSCDIRGKQLVLGTTRFNHANPQIVVHSGVSGRPVVVVYQRSDAQPPTSLMLFYSYMTNSGAGAVFQSTAVTNNAGTFREQNPAVVYNNNKIHVAYSADTNKDGQQDEIRYINLTWNPGGALGKSFETAFFPNSTYATSPDFPSIDASGNTLMLVWELKRRNFADTFNLVYNRSNDNGGTWFNTLPAPNTTSYRYLPSNNKAETGPVNNKDNRSSTDSANDPEFIKRLRPDVMISSSSPLTVHVVWHEDVEFRHDVMYTYFNGTTWQGTPILYNEPVPNVTNVTRVYGDSLAFVNDDNQYPNVRPKVLYGPPGTRVQVVYLSVTTFNAWDVMYNGWQLGPTKDVDCDSIPDTVERVAPPTCPKGAYISVINSSGTGSPNHYNCNNDFDRLPDMLDTNSDGDYLDDYDDYNNDPDPKKPKWRVFDQFKGALLPTIIKE